MDNDKSKWGKHSKAAADYNIDSLSSIEWDVSVSHF